jgi:hypothetical protein
MILINAVVAKSAFISSLRNILNRSTNNVAAGAPASQKLNLGLILR